MVPSTGALEKVPSMKALVIRWSMLGTSDMGRPAGRATPLQSNCFSLSLKRWRPRRVLLLEDKLQLCYIYWWLMYEMPFWVPSVGCLHLWKKLKHSLLPTITNSLESMRLEVCRQNLDNSSNSDFLMLVHDAAQDQFKNILGQLLCKVLYFEFTVSKPSECVLYVEPYWWAHMQHS